MKAANLSSHARQRISERCSLTEVEVKDILDNDSSVLIQLQKGGRYTHRLIYSIRDEGWFMIVQDYRNGGVLTVMPLEFLTGRTPVTAAQKRLARSRALKLKKEQEAVEKIQESRQIKAVEPEKIAPVESVEVKQTPPFPGWRIQVHYIHCGKVRRKKLAYRTPEAFGNPSDWQNPGQMHHWIKCQLLAAAIPLASVQGFFAIKGKETQQADCLLELMPLTQEEIQMFR